MHSKLAFVLAELNYLYKMAQATPEPRQKEDVEAIEAFQEPKPEVLEEEKKKRKSEKRKAKKNIRKQMHKALGQELLAAIKSPVFWFGVVPGATAGALAGGYFAPDAYRWPIATASSIVGGLGTGLLASHWVRDIE